MSVDTELLELAREVQGCDVRLGLLRADDIRNLEVRGELEQRRTTAAARLAELEAEHGWQEPPPAA
jgi:hypothetical protein